MSRPALLDANLALLHVVGLANRDYIEKHKRLKAFDRADFDLLQLTLSEYSGIILTPNVLSETCNILTPFDGPMRRDVRESFGDLILRHPEKYTLSRDVVSHESFERLGLTDTVLLTIARSGAELLTVDLDLYIAAVSGRLPARNFNHIRDRSRPDFWG